MSRQQGQQQADLNRKYYDVVFPNEMSDKEIHAFIRAIGKNLRSRNRLGGVPTMVFEVWASAEGGITHRLRVPSEAAIYLVGQLQNALPGIDVTERQGKEDIGFQFGGTIHMRNSSEELPVANAMDYSHRVLASMQDAVQPHDAVVVQWIIAHSDDQKMPPSDQPVKSQRSGMKEALFGPKPAGRDEVQSRRNKQVDQNYIAVGRVAARGEDVRRAEQLTRQVVRAITSEGGNAHFYAKESSPQEISKSIKHAITPLRMTAQLSVTELAAVIGWPMGDVYVPGLQRGTTRHMPAPESVPRNGRVLGRSTMPGIDRQIAMSYDAALTHTYVAGGTGVGKTTLMVNTIRQDMETGAGIILIEREGNLFQQALDQVPPHRANDVICIDLSQTTYPIGLNLLRTNKPEIVAGQFASLLEGLFPDSAKGVNASQLILNGVPVLANLERATLSDLLVLAEPHNPAEKAWALDAASKHPDKMIRDFWLNDWYKRDQKTIAKDALPFKNRMRELFTPEPTRYLLNQETSSFDPLDVINGNKLLFVNLSGVSEQVASLIGTMLVTSIWSAAKKGKPNKPNFMYLDEFQRFAHLSHDFEDMLAEARKYNLGLVIATQYIERLRRETQDAVMANARTKIIFQSSSNSSGIHATDFASSHVRRESFMNLKAHDALARIMTRSGISEPITLHTFPEPQGFNHGRQILETSARLYGRTKSRINQDDSTRRVVRYEEPPQVDESDFGPADYDPDSED
ncbi:type IV secretory system conjugative DNA transfer family protein [Mycobacteroides abscessus]|uniref:type IV secretory system conjugative DNA transfer family protein n=1 Tax=Mycobacteroides abscessus TaxID=36809 RepID=UPI0012FFEDAC|nr:TraM recognition domain-containing protein [Mycobacteroides abscessus]